MLGFLARLDPTNLNAKDPYFGLEPATTLDVFLHTADAIRNDSGYCSRALTRRVDDSCNGKACWWLMAAYCGHVASVLQPRGLIPHYQVLQRYCAHLNRADGMMHGWD